MKKVMAAVICLAASSGCISSSIKSQRNIFASLNQDEKLALLKQKTGLKLEEIEVRMIEVRSAPEELGMYSKPVDMLSASDVASLFNTQSDPSNKLLPGDLLLGINGVSALNNPDAAKNPVFLDGKLRATFFSPTNNKLKVFEIRDTRLFSSISFSSNAKSLTLVRVRDVAPGSWGEKRGFIKGDLLVHGFLLDGESYRATLFSSVITKSDKKVDSEFFHNTAIAADLLLKIFADKKALLGTEKVSLEKNSFLKLMVISGDEFLVKQIQRMRFLGLGVEFRCDPESRCGNVLPQIAIVYSDSEGGRSGFIVDDLIQEINGKPIQTSWEALKAIRSAPLGKEIVFKVKRGLEVLEIKSRKGLVVSEK